MWVAREKTLRQVRDLYLGGRSRRQVLPYLASLFLFSPCNLVYSALPDFSKPYNLQFKGLY